MGASKSAFRFTAVRPELPPIEAWRGYAEEAYCANWFSNFGALSRRLEHVLAERWGFEATGCVVASSATAGLAGPLIARGIEGPVLIPAFTFPATLSAVKMAGAQPVLMDVSPDTWRVSPETLEAAFMTTGARAAILLCPFGLRTDFAAHMAVAQAHNATLVIDDAAGIGVARANVETSPDVFEVYSMHATKPFGIGEGGAIFANKSNEPALRSALNFGLLNGRASLPWGINGKMSELQAAVGLAVANTFGDRLTRRRAFASRYMDVCARYDGLAYTDAPNDSCWQMFPLLTPSAHAASAAIASAAARGMEVRRYYSPSLSTLPGFHNAPCPVSEDLAARMICFPVYSWLSAGEAEEMLDIVDTALGASVEGRP
ncbi:MAG: aminotransferase class I/II-fold pyridoxal phosphate-dependent enzyme [Vitreimonas sp.]